MSISYQIPTQSRFISTSTIFTAQFNVPTPGRYDFNVPANQNISVIELLPGVVYLIERISTGGTLGENLFLESIDLFPELVIRRSLSGEIVYQRPIPIVNYADGIECSAWIFSDLGNLDNITLSLSGSLVQLPAMVGIGEVRLQVGLSIYGIDSAYYNTSFRDVQNISIGQRNRT